MFAVCLANKKWSAVSLINGTALWGASIPFWLSFLVVQFCYLFVKRGAGLAFVCQMATHLCWEPGYSYLAKAMKHLFVHFGFSLSKITVSHWVISTYKENVALRCSTNRVQVSGCYLLSHVCHVTTTTTNWQLWWATGWNALYHWSNKAFWFRSFTFQQSRSKWHAAFKSKSMSNKKNFKKLGRKLEQCNKPTNKTWHFSFFCLLHLLGPHSILHERRCKRKTRRDESSNRHLLKEIKVKYDMWDSHIICPLFSDSLSLFYDLCQISRTVFLKLYSWQLIIQITR